MSKRPPSNLNPDAEPWGRWVSKEIESNEGRINALRNDADNSERINNSTLDSLASQIREVDARPSNLWTWPDLNSPSFNGSSGPVIMTLPTTIVPPPPDGIERWGWINFNAYLTQSVSAQTDAQVSISINGAQVVGTVMQVPPSPSWPVGLGDSISASFISAFRATSSSPAQIGISIRLDAYDPVNRVVAISRTATVQYAQPYLPS